MHTTFYGTQVAGTRFNVKAYADENRVATTLEDDEVIILYEENPQLSGGIVLKTGQ